MGRVHFVSPDQKASPNQKTRPDSAMAFDVTPVCQYTAGSSFAEWSKAGVAPPITASSIAHSSISHGGSGGRGISGDVCNRGAAWSLTASAIAA